MTLSLEYFLVIADSCVVRWVSLSHQPAGFELGEQCGCGGLCQLVVSEEQRDQTQFWRKISDRNTYLEDLFWTIMITRELSWSLEDLGFTSGPVALAPTSCPYTYIVVPFICVRTPKTGFCKWAGGHNMSCNVLFPLSPPTMCGKWKKNLSFKISHRHQYEYNK